MSLYKQPGSDIWWMRFTLTGYPRIRESTGETDREEAQRVEIRRQAEVLSQPAALKGKSWSSAVLKWSETKDPSYVELLSLQKFNTFFPDRMLSSITGDLVDAALKKFCKHPATYNRHRSRVLGILALSKVTIDLAPRKVKEVDADWLTYEQWELLRAELPPHMLPMATFAITTGLRQANVLQLRWDRVDLTRALVWVDASNTKSGKPIAVPLSIEAINVLKSVQGQHPEFCFTYRGRPVSEIKTAFMSACIRAGVGRYVKGQYTGFTWHGFRHTWATWHVQNGTPLDVLQKLGGWASYSMVLRYGKHSAGYLAQYANNTKEKKT